MIQDLVLAWKLWADSFLHDAAQLPYRVAVIAFMAGAILAWFAARDWFRGGGDENAVDGSGD